MSSSPRTLAILAAACFALLWFANLQYRDLFQTDEGRYAEIPREMLVSGDWVTPRLDGLKYFEKPVLQYWTTAATYAVFGESNWTSRLWTALTGFLGVLLTAWIGFRLFDRRTGWAAALLLASSFYYVIMGHFNTLDMGLSFFMSATLFGFLMAMQAADRDDLKSRRLWMYVAWAAAALAILSKGLEAVVLPGAVFVIYTLVSRDWKRWKQLHYYGGLLIFLVIAAPWYVLVSLRNPDFFHYFFVYQHFERFLTPVAHRPGAWWYFIPILMAGVLPWWPQFGRAIVHWLKPGDGTRSQKGEFNPVLFMWIWCLFIFVFFSFSDSKLGSYILPIFPALALLIGRQLGKLRRGDLLISAVLCAIMALVTLWLAPMLKQDGGGVPIELYKAFLPWLVVSCGLLMFAAAGGFVLAYFRKPCAAVGLLAGGMLVTLQIITSGAQALSPVYSGHSIAKQLGNRNTAGAPFYSVHGYQQSLPFYLKRTLTLVAYQGELAFGIRQAPDKWIPDMQKFEQRWQQDSRAFAVMPKATYQTLLKQNFPMKLIAQDPERVIVEKP